jgi:uncharacterized protein YjbI with pentapeptide repeats
MKISKDAPLSILTKVFGYKGKYFLAASILLGFKLTPERGILPEEEIWSLAADNLGRDEALDLGMSKPQGEVLVSGWCFPAGGRPVDAAPAGFQVGKVEKRIVVIGDRYWLDSKSLRHTAPLPFTRMQLCWERSFGGGEYKLNPLGVGMEPQKLKDGGSVFPLPNLEDPLHPVATPDDRPRPAGFGPLGMSWPDRLKGLGNFDQKWQNEHWPGFPQDFDFSYFNVAPYDQRLNGYFHGNEHVATLHMTEDAPTLTASLPGIKARIFIIRKNTPGRNWLEAKANLDTVWLFPHAKSGVLIWHGVWETADDEAEDIGELMAVTESLAAPEKPAAEHEVRLRDAEEKAVPPPARESMPPPEGTAEMETGISTAAVAAGGGAAIAATAAVAVPFLSAAPAEAATGTMNDLPPEMAKYEPLQGAPPPGATDDEIIAFYGNRILLEQERLNDHLRQLGLDPEALPPVNEPPPVPDAAEMIAMLAAVPGDHSELIATLQEADGRRQAAEKESAALLSQGEQPVPDGEAVREPAGSEPDGDAMATGPEAKTREVAARLAGGRDLTGMDLTEVDLRPFSLAGADLSGANLEGVNLAGHSLSGAVFSRALMAGAVLSGASLAGASLTGASASRIKLDGADLKGADLAGMDLTGANLQGADLREANLSGANLSEANLSRVKGSGVQARGALFIGADLTGADFTGALFAAADLSEASLQGVLFPEADLSEVWFSDADASGGDFRRANMTAAKGEGKTVFRNADLANADLKRSYFEDADFSAANLSGADLTGTSLTRCLMKGANLTHTRARQADLSKSDLTGADMQGMDLMEGSLRKARLTGADLRQANLFAVDVFKCILGDTRTEGANLKRTLLTVKGGNS